MPIFLDILAKRYDPSSPDQHLFALNLSAPHCVPLVALKMIADDGYGTATVDGVPISRGKCVQFDFSPFPIYFLPVGEVAREFGKTYTVRLSGYRSVDGKRFPNFTFKVKTPEKRLNDGTHEEQDRVAKQAADEGIVLLRNDGTLPLRPGSKLCLLGDYRDFRISAIGASLIKPRWNITMEKALAAQFELSPEADTALYVISRESGEGRDNKPIPGGYYLTQEEKDGLRIAVRTHSHVILVLSTGYPVEMAFIQSLGLSAILWSGYSGQAGALSVADILCGKICPSGRLADTWPLDYTHTPASRNFIHQEGSGSVYSDDGRKFGAHVYYEEGLFVGYRYFDTFGKKPAWPFGHGLSYTNFRTTAQAEYGGDTLRVEAEVTNVGGRGGKHTVLVYVQSPTGRLVKPSRVFCGFEKTGLLSPNQTETLLIAIPAKDFAVYDPERWVFLLEPGEYTAFVGGSIAEAEVIHTFTLEKEQVLENTISVCAPMEPMGSMEADEEVPARSKIVPTAERITKHAAGKVPVHRELPAHRGKPITFGEVRKDLSKLDAFVAQFTLRELVDFTVCNGTCYQSWKNGAAAKLAHSKRLGIPTHYMSDGNCGVNINSRTTGFPSSNLLAGAFNKQLAYEVGRVLAMDSKEHNITINLGPGGNLHRNLLCGRHPEYFSEDPILSGTLMAWQARGQEENGVGATYKHFLANGMEFERKASQSIVAERPLRELYLRVFDKALSLYHPSCVMTSYNPVNGIYPSENGELLHDLLRKTWGFDGFVMTDWGGCDTADPVASVNAGTNLLTPGDRKLFRTVYAAARRGDIPKATLQAGVGQIIKVLVRRTV